MDSMIFADGCGATIISATEEDNGVLAYQTYSHAQADLGKYLSLYIQQCGLPLEILL
jgi:3-oxoacyl-[acyl-carrier-protein] synthase III